MWHAQDGRTALMHAVNIAGTFVEERLSALHVLLKAGANKIQIQIQIQNILIQRGEG
jgi:hypothetical protein